MGKILHAGFIHVQNDSLELNRWKVYLEWSLILHMENLKRQILSIKIWQFKQTATAWTPDWIQSQTWCHYRSEISRKVSWNLGSNRLRANAINGTIFVVECLLVPRKPTCCQLYNETTDAPDVTLYGIFGFLEGFRCRPENTAHHLWLVKSTSRILVNLACWAEISKFNIAIGTH